MKRDPAIKLKHALPARLFQMIYPAMQHAFFRPSELEFATRTIAAPQLIKVTTRHGLINALVFAPPEEELKAQSARGERAPVHLLTHGGAFILQYPIEEGNVARYLASEVGCYVVIPDYNAAPQVRLPVADEQYLDTLRWIRANAVANGWDKDRVSVGGPSAGGSFALGVALEAIEQGDPTPVAVTSEYGVADMSRTDAQRTSSKKMPVVAPPLMNLVRNTYYKDVDVLDPRASPIFHPMLERLPPTLIMTAEFDTLKHESNDLAAKLRTLGVATTHHEFPGVDHGFTHQKPVETARQAITMIGAHLSAAYRRALNSTKENIYV